MLNGRARYLATVRGEAVDFLPRTPILMQYAAEHIGSDYAALAPENSVWIR
jgi:uroporphyrinogen decarboxylase